MIKISGIYEQGVIRPLKKLPFRDHQKVEIFIEDAPDPVKATKGIIRVRERIGKLIVQSPQFSPYGA